MKPFRPFLLCGLIHCFAFVFPAIAEDQQLTIATWGGSYERAQQVALFEPFEDNTDIQINTQFYTGELAILKSDFVPDIIDMTLDDALLACEQNKIIKMDTASILAETKKGIKPNSDFVEGTLLPCGVAHLSYSTLIAYDERAFSGEKPQSIDDFFDIKRFPGKRAIQKKPTAVLEWALIAEGAPINQVYDLLSTERGMRLAFRRLDSIKNHIIWWDNPKEPAALLKSGKAVMASGFNGRFFDAQIQGAPITMIWDAQIIDWNVWVIPNKAKADLKLIHQFINFVTQTENMAHLAENIPYGPSRKSALSRIGVHPTKKFSMRDHLPTSKHHLKSAIFRDAEWYAKTSTLRKNRFWQWLNALDSSN